MKHLFSHLEVMTKDASCRLRDSRGSQIVEFAVSLPLLLVLVVGIFDFGNAYNLKQKVAHSSREAARLGSSQATADLTTATPASVLAIRDAVVKDLQNASLSDCGLSTASATAAGAAAPWTWSFTTSCGATIGNLVLTVDRGKVITTNMVANGTNIKMIGTSVTVQYPYKWEFDRVIGLLVPGATYPGTSQISVTSYMANQN
jgi:Flp pilus assembly protein TadG